MTRRRRVRPDEEALWRKVADQTERLHAHKPLSPEDFVETPPPATPRTPMTFEAIRVPQITPRPEPATRIDMAPAVADQVHGSTVQMDKKSFAQMKRGKLRPEAKLDLHGMTLDRAHPALTRFILSAHAQGKRLVLVVTGKGKDRDEGGPIPVRLGVLRHQVPQWLSVPPLSTAVLQVSAAHNRHGGGGAYYVYLRKRR
ncbi:Smr/MutS family protein [uncultured Tateyamaria sp.]|uniref:Smr/MutS family protein n=1 Tax=Tateyamaria sp. 1078 TaxID=3417464 RepID=UPI00262D3CEA|nr:Smr/MutS family protein [uncultured Tateyamaria sp.]